MECIEMTEMPGICRCCLSVGVHKDIKTPYFFLDKMEIYSEMLLDCFNIVLLPLNSRSNTICDDCIKILRMSSEFKCQVLKAEEDLLKRSSEEWASELKLSIKLEPKADSDNESDDNFLADTVSEVPIDTVKSEKPESTAKKKSEPKKKKSKTDEAVQKDVKWKSNKIKKLVSRLGNISTCVLPTKIKKEVKKRTITLSKDKPKLKISWTRASEKVKHMENLQNILKYSNAMPFKNKSLLGFICAYCYMAFPDPTTLRAHTETDHKAERLNLKHKVDLTDYCIKLDINDLICTLCDERLPNLTVLKEHLTSLHGKTIHNDVKDHLLQFKLKKGDIFDCAMCSSTYETFKMLTQHMNLHYNNFSCTKCEAAFATRRSLAAHRTTHQEGSFKCEQCDKIFASRAKKLYHVKIKHLGTRNISNCPYCDEPFRSYYQRNQHLIKVHNSEAPYKCNICNRGFVLKSLLMYHVKKNHLMERNAQCTECGYRFFSKKALKAHMVKHTGERNYSCEVCHKSYARKYTLREHMRIHNNDRRFKCDVCGMTFVQKCSLKSHLLSNHGISLMASEINST